MTTTSATITGTVAEVQWDASDAAAWTDLSNILTDNDSTAAVTPGISSDGLSRAFRCTNFGFDIPEGSSIDGITVQIRCSTSGNFDFRDVVLSHSGKLVGANIAGQLGILSAEGTTTKSLGGATETWGIPLRAEFVNASTFGVEIRPQRDGGSSQTLSIYWVKIVIDYTEGGLEPMNTRADWQTCAVYLPQDADLLDGTAPCRAYLPDIGTPVHFFCASLSVLQAQSATSGDDVQFASTANFGFGGRSGASGDQFNNLLLVLDNQNPATSRRDPFDDRIGNEQTQQITVDSVGDGYVQFDFATDSFPRIMIVTAFGGTQVDAETKHWGITTNAPGADLPVTFDSPMRTTEFIIESTGLELPGTPGHGAYTGIGFGAALPNGHTRALSIESDITDAIGGGTDGVLNWVWIDETLFHINRDFGSETLAGDPIIGQQKLKYFTGAGATLEIGGDDLSSPSDPEDGGSLIGFSSRGGAQWATGTVTTPSSTGIHRLTLDPPPPFEPTWAMLILTSATSINAAQSGAQGNALAVAFIREGRIMSMGSLVIHNDSPSSDTASAWSRNRLAMLSATAGTRSVEAHSPTFSTGEIAMNFVTAASAFKGIYMAMGPGLGDGRQSRHRPNRLRIR